MIVSYHGISDSLFLKKWVVAVTLEEYVSFVLLPGMYSCYRQCELAGGLLLVIKLGFVFVYFQVSCILLFLVSAVCVCVCGFESACAGVYMSVSVCLCVSLSLCVF